jgi:hypothetical protein
LSKTQIRDYYPDIYLKLLELERKHDCAVGVYHNQTVLDDCDENYYKYEHDLNDILEEIRARNRFNTTLEQFFDRTLHFGENIDCEVHYKDGKVMNCTQIHNLVEYFDGFNFFGKCFIYLNNRRKYSYNKSEKSSNSEHYIEFKIDLINYKNILSNYHIFENVFKTFIGIHPQNKFLSSLDLLRLNTGFSYEFIYNNMILKSLEWPYSTDCLYYDNNNLYHSYEDCMEYCSLFKQNSSLQCLTDPSDLSHFPVSDKKMNVNFKQIKICENPKKLSIRECIKFCKRSCNEEYYRTSKIIEFDGISSVAENQYLVRIKAENSQIFEYSANPKYSFIIFATNIGSLMSLWLGISAIDLKIILKILVNLKKNYLNLFRCLV